MNNIPLSGHLLLLSQLWSSQGWRLLKIRKSKFDLSHKLNSVIIDWESDLSPNLRLEYFPESSPGLYLCVSLLHSLEHVEPISFRVNFLPPPHTSQGHTHWGVEALVEVGPAGRVRNIPSSQKLPSSSHSKSCLLIGQLSLGSQFIAQLLKTSNIYIYPVSAVLPVHCTLATATLSLAFAPGLIDNLP